MPTYFASEFVGVRDGTKTPPDRADGRMVGAKESTIRASKPAAQALAIGDLLFIGALAPGERIKEIVINSDTSLGTTTVSIGTLALPTKYVNAATLTAPLNVPVNIGPRAAPHAAAPLAASEDLYATFGVAAVGGAVVLGIETTIASIK